MILRLQTGLCWGLGSARPWGCIPQTRELLQWHRLRGFCALPPFTALLGARMITETLLGKAGTEPPQREELGAAWHRVPKFTPSRKTRCSGEWTSKIPVLAGGRHRVGPAVTPAQGALLSAPPDPSALQLSWGFVPVGMLQILAAHAAEPRQRRCRPRGCSLPTRELLCGEHSWEEGKNRRKKGRKTEGMKEPRRQHGRRQGKARRCAARAASAPGMEQEARRSWGSPPASIFPALPSSSSARIAPQEALLLFVKAQRWHKSWYRAWGGLQAGPGAPL